MNASAHASASEDDGDREPADRFCEAWGDLLRSAHDGTLTSGTTRRLVNRTTVLLNLARTSEPVDPGPASEAGAMLVHAHYTDPATLARAVELLLDHGADHGADDGRGPALAGAFAAGWAMALRERTLREQ